MLAEIFRQQNIKVCTNFVCRHAAQWAAQWAAQAKLTSKSNYVEVEFGKSFLIQFARSTKYK